MKKTVSLLSLWLCFALSVNAQINIDAVWTMIGGTNADVAPYNLLYYKVAEIKSINYRYASVFDVSVQGDANYFEQQGTYRLRIDKFEWTENRFDGVEVQCVSGNPTAATFYVFNNAVWVRSNYLWGGIFTRTVGHFSGASPMTGGAWGQTLQPPAGYLTYTTNFGLKCDFDNNRIFKLPYTDATGSLMINGKVGIGTITPGDFRLAVAGTIGAQKVKVTQTGWADYVFEPDYALPSIDSIAGYVREHKHLPEIPSAKEVKKEGIDLGEMNKKLLAKIEEQMLYIIQLKKEMNVIKTDLESLKKK
jgi:hypothetical protein